MKAEQKEIYNYTADHFENEIKAISPDCVAPLIAVRQLVKKSMEKYITDYCSKDTKIEDVFSEDDFQEISKRITNELK